MSKPTTNTDPIRSDQNGVRTAPLGTFSQEKSKYLADPKNADTKYTRADYRDALRENKKQRKSEGQAVGISSDKGSAVTNLTTQMAGQATDIAMAGIKVDENSQFNKQQAVGDMLISSGNPYAAIAGAALKVGSAMDQALGTNINTISKSESKATGISGAGRLINNVLGFLPTGGMGALANRTDSYRVSEEAQQLAGAFGGSVEDMATAQGMSGGRYIIGRDKINSLIQESKRQDQLLRDLNVTNTQRKMSDYGTNLAQQNLNRYAGNNYQNTHIGKHGMKLVSVEEIRAILNARKEESDVQSFHNGGVIGIDVNVIPEGKYHAHKNHLEDVSEEFDDLTKKGIPVVAHSEGGEIEQVAEIEKMELIFRLEVTNKLEELFKDGSEDAMIKAGKLVAYEIIENTQDNSGEVLKDE